MATTTRTKWLFDNRLLRSATLLTSNVTATFPLANIKLPQRSRAAQLVGVSGIQLIIDFGVSHTISFIAWAGTNLSHGAEVQIWHNSTNSIGTATLLTTVTQVQPTVILAGLSQEYVNFWVGDPVADRYWWLIFSDIVNTDGFIRLGVVGMGLATEFAYDVQDDVTYGFEPRGRAERTAGGTPVSDRLSAPKTLTLSYQATAADTWATLMRLLSQLNGSELWCIPMPLASTEEKQSTALYGQCTTLPSATMLTVNSSHYTVGKITLSESL